MPRTINVTRVSDGMNDLVLIDAIQDVQIIPSTNGSPGNPKASPPIPPTPAAPEQGRIVWRNSASPLVTVETQAQINTQIGV